MPHSRAHESPSPRPADLDGGSDSMDGHDSTIDVDTASTPSSSASETRERIRRSFRPLISVLAVGVASAVTIPLLSSKSEATVSEMATAVAPQDRFGRYDESSPQWRFVRIGEARSAPALPPPPVSSRVAFDEQRISAVSAPLNGRVEQILARVGDRVEEGARLALIRSAALSEFDREIEAARQAVDMRSRIVKRLTELLEAQAVAEREVLQAKAELKEAELALRGATLRRRSLQVEENDANSFWLTAPTSGTVLELDAARGQEVGPDSEPLLRMGELDEVLVLADVPEHAALDVEAGVSVDIHLSGETRKGHVEAVSGLVDPHRRTVAVRIRASNADGRLRPNGWVEVVFPPAAENRIRVPSEAVVTDGPRSIVFVLNDDGVFQRTTVRAGRENGTDREVLDGLVAGQKVATRGALLLLNQVDVTR